MRLVSPLCRASSAVLLLSLAACQTLGGLPSEEAEGEGPRLPPEVLVGAGDIASCESDGDEATAAMLDGLEGTVFTLGDNAYPDGTAQDFARCYAPSWGRHRQRTRPAVGNHEYHSAQAGPYFDYFGGAAGEPGKGYYSYDLGAWHVVVLNSQVELGAGSEQDQWLRADLKANTRKCTLAYWHRPLFSSGPERETQGLQSLWEALYEADAEVVLGGHDHYYERFAPQRPDGREDKERGIRQFVVGTGGMALYDFTEPLENSEVRKGGVFGVLKLTLEDGGYAWEFLPVGGGVADQGRGTCH
ncbi:MAG TPA: metallophosphoesterase [Archangium sp.]|nr:metallophosphoesterase [Archangium sp.]